MNPYTPQDDEHRRPGYMFWFFPVLLGFFFTLAIALILLWYVPGWWPWESGPTEEDQALLAERHREADLRTELALLNEDLTQRLASCPADLEPLALNDPLPPEHVEYAENFVPEIPPEPEPEPIIEEPYPEVAELPEEPLEEPVIDEPVIDEPVMEEPDIDEPIVEEPIEEEPIIDEPDPDEDFMDNLDPPLEEPPYEEPYEEPMVEEPIVEEPPYEEPAYEPDNGELDIPDDAEETGNLDFLEGCWISETGLTNRDTGQPVTVRYCFDAYGNGSREVLDMRGPCYGGAYAQMQPDGSLVIHAGDAGCSFGGVSYVDGLITCVEGADGKTHCNGQGGGVNWNSHFTRQGY